MVTGRNRGNAVTGNRKTGKGEKKMNAVELKKALQSKVPFAADYTVYDSVINAIMKFYMNSCLDYDYPEALKTMDLFIKRSVLVFNPAELRKMPV